MNDLERTFAGLKEAVSQLPEADREQVFNCAMIFKLILRQWGRLGGLAFSLVGTELQIEIEKEMQRQSKEQFRGQQNGH